MFELLSLLCRRVRRIDDLVFWGVHTATLTLAYARSMRDTGRR